MSGFLVFDSIHNEGVVFHFDRLLPCLSCQIINNNIHNIQRIEGPNIIVGRMIAHSNSPIFETNHPNRVIKVGIPLFNSIENEAKWYRIMPEIGPQFYGDGNLIIRDVRFPFILIERLEYSLEDYLPQSREEIRKIWSDMNEILFLLHNKGLVYNDFKPSNVMWSQREQKWKLVDLESIQEMGVQETEHTPGYAPKVCLTEEFPILNAETDRENLFYMIHDVITRFETGHRDPWIDLKSGQEIIDLRNNRELMLPRWLME